MLVVGCHRVGTPAPPSGPPAPIAPAVTAIDAGPPALTPPPRSADAAVAGSAEADFTLYETEVIGPLHAKLTGDELVKVLGSPARRTRPQAEEATGAWVSHWRWAGVEVDVTADTRSGPWTTRSVTVTAPPAFATRRGVHVGSARAEVLKLYPGEPGEVDDRPQEHLAGSPYGGMLFTFKDDKVASITIGVFAE
jgi:hypothetical protein